jgi:2-oxoisovalerate dehydrogenase E1 component
MVPFGKANIVREGTDATIVTWGAMVSRAVEAVEALGASVEILDLRTIIPWDKEAILESVRKTNRVLVLCEDNWTANFAAEICSTISQDAFDHLDAPVERLSTIDVPIPYNVGLMDAVLPGVEMIKNKLSELLQF